MHKLMLPSGALIENKFGTEGQQMAALRGTTMEVCLIQQHRAEMKTSHRGLLLANKQLIPSSKINRIIIFSSWHIIQQITFYYHKKGFKVLRSLEEESFLKMRRFISDLAPAPRTAYRELTGSHIELWTACSWDRSQPSCTCHTLHKSCYRG